MTDSRKDESEWLCLRSESLLSKWGFNDGDKPAAFYDYCYAHGVDSDTIDWQRTLIKLVRMYLVPVIEQKLEVYEIETIHNPIRTSSVDGVWIDDTAIDSGVELTPESVLVPWATVIAEAVRR